MKNEDRARYEQDLEKLTLAQLGENYNRLVESHKEHLTRPFAPVKKFSSKLAGRKRIMELTSTDIQEQFRPWLFQAVPSSYQFAVRVQKTAQMPLFPDGTPEIDEVIGKFFNVLSATTKETPEELEKIVPDNNYLKGKFPGKIV